MLLRGRVAADDSARTRAAAPSAAAPPLPPLLLLLLLGGQRVVRCGRHGRLLEADEEQRLWQQRREQRGRPPHFCPPTAERPLSVVSERPLRQRRPVGDAREERRRRARDRREALCEWEAAARDGVGC